MPIHDVVTKPLRLIPDERGWLMEVLRADDRSLFEKFGQVYVSAPILASSRPGTITSSRSISSPASRAW